MYLVRFYTDFDRIIDHSFDSNKDLHGVRSYLQNRCQDRDSTKCLNFPFSLSTNPPSTHPPPVLFLPLCLCLCLYLCLCLCLCLCVICAFNYDLREDVNMAIARASQFWWLGLRAFTASFPIYLWFLFGPIPAILLLTSLILRALWHHFFCCTQIDSHTIPPSRNMSEDQQDNQYNRYRPQSELLIHVL
mgnify:CR=1 FL=1